MGKAMVEALVDVMLGDVGRALVARYNENHLIINAIVLVYGSLLIWAHVNLRRVTRQMEALIVDLARDSKLPLNGQLLFEKFRQRWKAAAGGKKLLLPTRNDLWFTLTARADLIEALWLRKEYLDVVLSKAGVLEPPGSLSKQTYRIWETYRHQLLMGVRARHLEPEVQQKIRGRQAGS